MPTPSTISDRVDLAIRQLMDGGTTSPAQIYKRLEELHLIDEDGIPSPKAVLRHAARLRPKIDPRPWSMLDADAEEVRLVTPVLREINAESYGRMWPSQDLASWVAKVRAADGDIPALWAWNFARAYQGAKQRGDPDSRCLDLALMAQAWDDPVALHPVVENPDTGEPEEAHSELAEVCHRMGRGKQWYDLAMGQWTLGLELMGISLDPPRGTDRESPPVAPPDSEG